MINEEERSMAAKFFTIRNLAMDMYLTKDIDNSYRRIDDMLVMDCGCSANAELKDWQKMVNNGDKYCFDEWQKVRETYINK